MSGDVGSKYTQDLLTEGYPKIATHSNTQSLDFNNRENLHSQDIVKRASLDTEFPPFRQGVFMKQHSTDTPDEKIGEQLKLGKKNEYTARSSFA